MNDENLFAPNLKILRHVDRIAALRDGKNPPPINISLDLTYGCGHRCPKCSGDPQRTRSLISNELSDDKFRDIFAQLHDYGVLSVTFVGGGETMVRSHCEKLISYASSIGLQTGLLTNGQIMSEKQALEIIPILKYVRVSLDASDPEMFRETHGMEDPEEFYRVLRNIKRLVKIKRKLGSECRLGVSYLTGQSTLRGMVDAVKIVKEIGVDYIQFKPFRGDLTLIDRELEECKNLETVDFKIFSSKPKYDSARAREERSYPICYAQQFFSQIDPNGNVTICCDHKGDSNMVLGNLREKTFKQIWESDERKRVIQAVNLDFCPLYCRGHSINVTLEQIMTEQEHESFL